MTADTFTLVAVTGIAMRGICLPVEVGQNRVDGPSVTVAVEVIAIFGVAVVTRVRSPSNLPLGIENQIDLFVDMLAASDDRPGIIRSIVMTILTGVFTDPLGADQHIVGTAGHLVAVAGQVGIWIDQIAVAIGTDGRGAVRPGNSPVRRAAGAITMAIEIVAGPGIGIIAAGSKGHILLLVDVQGIVADGAAVGNGGGVTFGAGKIVHSADMLRVIAA